MADSGSNSPAHNVGVKKTLGRYEILERLFSKGGAETFRARVRGLAGFDRIFAVKCLHTKRQGGWTINDPFLKTARRSAAVVDSHIARVLETDIVDGTAISVTEFIFGIDIERFLQCAELSGDLATGTDETALRWQKIVATIGSEVANGLAALHALTPPFIHGHLSPRNIFISSRASIKITDSGLYRSALLTGDLLPLAPNSHESPEYSEPPKAISPAADVYSLGSILFQLATGEPNRIENGPEETVLSLNTLCPSLAPELGALLEMDPNKRPSAKACAESLRILSKSLSSFAVGPELVALVRSYSVFSGSNPTETTEDCLPAQSILQPQQLDSNTTPPALSSTNVSNISPRPPMIPRPPSSESASDTTASASPQVPSPIPMQSTGTDGITLTRKRRNPTIMSFPVLATPVASGPPTKTAKTNPEPIRQTESNDWATRALAALGDQAGIPMPPIPLINVVPTQPTLPATSEEASLEEGLAHLSLPPLMEVPVQAKIPEIEPDGTFLTESDLEVAWPEDEAQPLSAPNLETHMDLNDFIDTPPLPLSTMIPSSRLTVSEKQTSASEIAPPGDPTRPRLVTIPTHRTAKRTEPHIPVTTETLQNAQRHKHLLFGILGVLCIGGLVGGGAGWLFSAPKKTPQALKRLETQPGSKPIGISLGTPALARKIGNFPASTSEKAAPKGANSNSPEPARKPNGPWVTVPIHSTPEGAMIWLGEKERGKTPLTIKERSGVAKLVLIKEGFISVKKTVQLTNDARLEETLAAVTPPLEGAARFRVECVTRGKYPIVVDGQETGILCPFSKMRVPPGLHRIGILIPNTGAVREKEITLQKGVRSVSFPE